MTDDQQRIEIAEFTGRNGWWCPQCKKLVSEYALGYQNRHANCTESAMQTPDYLNDLNAMHEAEKTLIDASVRYDYLSTLDSVVGHPKEATFAAVHATARQRAEALLRTIGKWQEDKP